MPARKRPRISVNLPAVANGSTFTITWMSDGGGLAESDSPLGEAGDTFDVNMAVDGVDLFAKIRLTNVRIGGRRYFSGFSFEEMSKNAAAAIHEHLAQRMIDSLTTQNT